MSMSKLFTSEQYFIKSTEIEDVQSRDYRTEKNNYNMHYFVDIVIVDVTASHID